MIVDIEVKNDRLNISYFDKEGDIAFKVIDIPESEQFNWVVAGPTDRKVDPVIRSWDGKKVKKVPLTDRKGLNKYRVEEILEKLPKEEIACIEEFNMPKKSFIDIEVEILEGFPDPESAKSPVTAISIANEKGNVIVLALKDITIEQKYRINEKINDHFGKFNEEWNFVFKKFDSEYDMLYTFFKDILYRLPCVTGWNLLGFDWPYLVNRCQRINIDPSICSPSGKLKGKSRLPEHKLVVDYLEIYKKWDRVVKMKENNKLDYVGQQAAGIGKIHYNGTLKDLYQIDFEKFVFYSAADSVLVRYIDKKINTMTTFFKIASLARVEILRAYSPIWVTEVFMLREFLKDNKVFTEVRVSGEQGSFTGAYVQDPVKGLHNAVACFDFASLYPNVMVQFNISPESYKGKKTELGAGEIRCANGAVFDNKNDSVLRKVLINLYGMRKQTKSKALAAEKEIERLQSFLK
jgi:DNA polymerase elongation subunit (family B)